MKGYLTRLLAGLVLVALAGCAEVGTMEMPVLADSLIHRLRAPFTSGSEADGSPAKEVARSEGTIGDAGVATGFAGPREAAGPSTAPAASSPGVPASPTRVALAHARYAPGRIPPPSLVSPPAGPGASAGQIAGGAAGGAMLGGLLGAQYIAACLGTGPFAVYACPPAVLMVGLGTLAGATSADQAASAAGPAGPDFPDLRHVTRQVTERPGVSHLEAAQATLSEGVRARLADDDAFEPVVLPFEAGPDSPAAKPRYAGVATAGAGYVLETRLLRIGFVGDDEEASELALAATARARLIRVPDGTEVAARDLAVIGRLRHAVLWAALDEDALAVELGRIYDQLAERIVDETVLRYELPRSRQAMPRPGGTGSGGAARLLGAVWNRLTGGDSREGEASAADDETLTPHGDPARLRALHPAPASRLPGLCALSERGCARTPAGHGFSEVEDLQPLFRWERLPRDTAHGGQVADRADRIADLRYELRIFAAPEKADGAWVPAGSPIVDARNLRSTSYRPTEPLDDCAYYFWTARARFRLDEEPHATVWAGTDEASLQDSTAQRDAGRLGEDGSPTSPDGHLPRWRDLPSSHYFPFKTPCPQ